MKKNCKFCWAVSGILVVIIAAMAYLFIIRGSVIESQDGRTAILMNENERNHVLGEMRGLLEAVQAITAAIVVDDMEAVAVSATSVGMILAKNEDPAMMAKLPLEFKKNGFAAHTAFDDLAQNARDFQDREMVLEELSVILGACTACHAGYRVALEDK